MRRSPSDRAARGRHIYIPIHTHEYTYLSRCEGLRRIGQLGAGVDDKVRVLPVAALKEACHLGQWVAVPRCQPRRRHRHCDQPRAHINQIEIKACLEVNVTSLVLAGGLPRRLLPCRAGAYESEGGAHGPQPTEGHNESAQPGAHALRTDGTLTRLGSDGRDEEDDGDADHGEVEPRPRAAKQHPAVGVGTESEVDAKGSQDEASHCVDGVEWDVGGDVDDQHSEVGEGGEQLRTLPAQGIEHAPTSLTT